MKSALNLVILAFLFSLSTNVHAQDYKTSLGLGIDFGTGTTWVGPSVKHFFNKNAAIQGDVLFGGNSTLIQAFYQHHFPIKESSNFYFYAGGGPGIELYRYGSTVFLKPMAGLEHTIKEAPLTFNFDWRPMWFLYEGVNEFEPARFGIGIRYSF